MKMLDVGGQALPGHDGMALTTHPVLFAYVTAKRKVEALREELQKAEGEMMAAFAEALKLPTGTKDDFCEVVRERKVIKKPGSYTVNTGVLRQRYPQELDEFIEKLRAEITDDNLPKGKLEKFLGKTKYSEVVQYVEGDEKEEVSVGIVEYDPTAR